jgi:hypothetical protein
MRVGRLEEALAMIGDELKRSDQLGTQQEAAELYRLKGEAFLMRDCSAADEAENCFRKAIIMAQCHQAKWWELLATLRPGALAVEAWPSRRSEDLAR